MKILSLLFNTRPTITSGLKRLNLLLGELELNFWNSYPSLWWDQGLTDQNQRPRAPRGGVKQFGPNIFKNSRTSSDLDHFWTKSDQKQQTSKIIDRLRTRLAKLSKPRTGQRPKNENPEPNQTDKCQYLAIHRSLNRPG